MSVSFVQKESGAIVQALLLFQSIFQRSKATDETCCYIACKVVTKGTEELFLSWIAERGVSQQEQRSKHAFDRRWLSWCTSLPE